jgi:CheY-like chemotaxis protein
MIMGRPDWLTSVTASMSSGSSPGAPLQKPWQDPMTPAASRVLFVDELADDLIMYGTGLRLLGFELCMHPSVTDALLDVAEFRPDVIVLHLGTGQWHLCDVFNEHPITRTVPIIVITAYVRPDRANRDRALSTPNCAAFVGKPCTHEDVAAVIRRVAAGERQIEFSRGPVGT